MISEPGGLPDQSFHRHRKTSSNKNNNYEQNQKIKIANLIPNQTFKNNEENSQEAEKFKCEISSVIEDLSEDKNTNKSTNQYVSEENMDYSNNETMNMIKSEFCVDSEATFISQSDFYNGRRWVLTVLILS